MASFLYFLPHANQGALVRDCRLNHDELKRWGLSHVLADVFEVPNHCVVTKIDGGGPGKHPGLVLAIHPANPAGKLPQVPSYNEESQSWVRVGKGDTEPYIGWVKDEPPGPEDLERLEAISGYRRPDRFGREWRMAVIRGRENQYGYLPVDYEWSPDSFIPGTVLRKQFESLWNESAKIWDHIYVEGFRCPDPFVAGFVAQCFGTNYRIGPRELEAFRRINKPVFDGVDVDEWAAIACDYPAVREYAAQKKMTVSQAAAAGTCSTAGEPAGTKDISQAVASCI